MNDDTTQVKRRAVMSRALLRSTQRLGLSRQRVASATGLRPAEIAALEAEDGELDPVDPRWNLFVQLVRLCWVLDAIAAGDDEAMRAWMLNYNPDLHAVPAELIGAERGLDETIEYLQAHGITRH